MARTKKAQEELDPALVNELEEQTQALIEQETPKTTVSTQETLPIKEKDKGKEKAPEIAVKPVIPEPPKPALLSYRKVGRGVCHFQGRIIREGQLVTCRPDDIPKGFRDLFKCTDPDAEKRVREQIQQVPLVPQYEIRPATAKDWYHIVNVVTGKKITTHALKLPKAEELLKAVNS